MAALAFVHERGVAHGSLGAGSLLLSTLSDSKAGQLTVKLDNFGFSQRLSLPPGGATDGISAASGLLTAERPAATFGTIISRFSVRIQVRQLPVQMM